MSHKGDAPGNVRMLAIGPWVRAASQGASGGLMSLNDVGNNTGEAVAVMPYAGSILAVSIRSRNARTAGNCSVEVDINGSMTGLIATIDGTNTQNDYTTQAAGLDTFVAGDRLRITYSSSAGFEPDNTGGDDNRVTAFMFVEIDL